ncbi:MAG: hypothetical protein QM710_09045 [Flavobacterium sp.]
MRFLTTVIILFFTISFYGQDDRNSYVATINGMEGNIVIKMRKEQFKKAVIGYNHKHKKDASINVTGFTLKIPGAQAEAIKGNKIDERMFLKILRNASRGDKITISDIKTIADNEKASGRYIDPAYPIIIEIY